MKTFRKLAVAAGIVAMLVCMGAGITGEFTQVNSVNGYLINGSAGSNGQALCSNGTYFGTPCTLSGGTITGVTAVTPLTGGGTSGTVSLGLAATGTAGTYASPSSITTDTYGRISAITASTLTASSGYQVLGAGLIIEWGQATSGATGDVPVTFPLQFPTALVSVTFGSDNTGADGGRDNCYVSAYASPRTQGFTASSGGSTNNCYWTAIGY